MGLTARVITHSGQPQVRNEHAAGASSFRLQEQPSGLETGPLAVHIHHWRRIGNAEIDPNRQHPVHHHIAAVLAPPPWTFGGMGIGYEKTLKEYIANLLAVFRECMRVLRKDGVLWLHLEDAHSHSGGHWRPESYIAWRPTQQKQVMHDVRLPSTTSIRPAKSLLMIPALVVLAMQDEGWLLRSKIIWDKGFARPDSAKIGPRSRTANCSCSANRHATRMTPIRSACLMLGRPEGS